MLKPLSGTVTGTGYLELSGNVLGGILIVVDGTNVATVIVREAADDTDTQGDKLFHMTAIRGFLMPPIVSGTKMIYYNVSGTGSFAMFYDDV